VKAMKGVSWLVVKSPPLARHLTLLKTILSNRFPTIKFDYHRFHEESLKRIKARASIDGVIAIIKHFQESQLEAFDRLTKKFSGSEIIFVLSPKTYQLLNQKRKKVLHRSLFVLSEMKCVDYVAALPRLVEEISFRHQLKKENEVLQALFKQNWDGPIPASIDLNPEDFSPKAKQKVVIQLRNWNQISKSMGSIAEIEFDQMIFRLISSQIRGGDQVLRQNENEYIILLEDIESKNLKRCVKRISSSLKAVRFETNAKKIPLHFRLNPPIDSLR